MSIQRSKQGPLVACYDTMSSNTLEIYDADFDKFPLYVYQLPPNVQHIQWTEEFAFVVTPFGNNYSIDFEIEF